MLTQEHTSQMRTMTYWEAGGSFRQPPARLLAMICLNIAISADVLMASPSRKATVRAVLLS